MKNALPPSPLLAVCPPPALVGGEAARFFAGLRLSAAGMALRLAPVGAADASAPVTRLTGRWCALSEALTEMRGLGHHRQEKMQWENTLQWQLHNIWQVHDMCASV